MKNRYKNGQRQQGAVLITTALALLFLLGFMGVALDFGRLFIVKSELQTAMDSCALAAARELDGRVGAISRASNAGVVAANLNPVDLQSATWRGSRQLISTDLRFFNTSYAASTGDADARYAECRFTKSGIQLWLLQAMGLFINDPARFPDTSSVGAFAVATLGNAQSACLVPLRLIPRSGGSPLNNYGYAMNEWVTMLVSQSGETGGDIGWVDLSDSANPTGGGGGAPSLSDQLNGKCGIKPDQAFPVSGVKYSVADDWNARFGIYPNGRSPSDFAPPDQTGFIYSTVTWTAGSAFSDYERQQALFASCGTLQFCRDALAPQRVGNGRAPALANAQPPLSTRDHSLLGVRNRRIVTVPVVEGNTIRDFACMLMLQPIGRPDSNVQLEFLGLASAQGSPCVNGSVPGGTSGPLVPVLVR